MRINRFLAQAGYGSRRHCESLITAGRVCLNGDRIDALATTVHPESDTVTVDGVTARLSEAAVYRYYKPRGVIATLDDESGRADLHEIASQLAPGTKPVGRLDRQSEGLLLWTNRGDWSQILMRPSAGHQKTYRVTVKGTVDEQALRRLREMKSVEGQWLRYRAVVELVEQRSNKAVLQFVLREGKNRQIRKMCAAVGLPIVRLVRIEQAGIDLEGLAPGHIEKLTGARLEHFLQVIQESTLAAAGRD